MSLQREYFCAGCGLFYWLDEYTKDNETGKLYFNTHQECPNKECISHKTEEPIAHFAVESFGFAYFCEHREDFISKNGWSSPDYAPKKAIDVYIKQGLTIK